MLSRRCFVASVLASAIPLRTLAEVKKKSKAAELAPEHLPTTVTYVSEYPPGTIVIDTASRFLYLIENTATARRYGIGVGKSGLAFSGTAVIGRKAKWPSWRPTDNMIRRSPKKYAKYANGMKGGPSNPLGSRALYLFRDGADTLYRIHGTNEPWTIGKAISNGCIRMVNAHVEELYDRVSVGALVVVLKASPSKQ